jgi:hypothetical protein
MVVDWRLRHYDTSTEVWLDGKWMVTRGYNHSAGLQTRSQWGSSIYKVDNDLILVSGPQWPWDKINVKYAGSVKEDYYTGRFESLNPPLYPFYPGTPANAVSQIKRWGWVETPIQDYWGKQPATVVGDCSANNNNGCDGGGVGLSIDPANPPAGPETHPEIAHFEQVRSDYGVDLNGNGRFDQLVVDVEVIVNQPGTYTIEGTLNDLDSQTRLGGQIDALDWVQQSLYLEPGTHIVPITFSGLAIGQKNVVGPYRLEQLLLTNQENSTPGEAFNVDYLLDLKNPNYIITTSSQPQAFEDWGATLTNIYDHQAQDNNGDGFFDTLIVNTQLNVTTAGTYQIEADLVDNNGDYITTTTWVGSATGGSSPPAPNPPPPPATQTKILPHGICSNVKPV